MKSSTANALLASGIMLLSNIALATTHGEGIFKLGQQEKIPVPIHQVKTAPANLKRFAATLAAYDPPFHITFSNFSDQPMTFQVTMSDGVISPLQTVNPQNMQGLDYSRFGDAEEVRINGYETYYNISTHTCVAYYGAGKPTQIVSDCG